METVEELKTAVAQRDAVIHELQAHVDWLNAGVERLARLTLKSPDAADMSWARERAKELGFTENREATIDWHLLNKRLRYFAIDSGGTGNVYQAKPDITMPGEFWLVFSGHVKPMGKFDLGGIDWRDTLIVRGEQPHTNITRKRE